MNMLNQLALQQVKSEHSVIPAVWENNQDRKYDYQPIKDKIRSQIIEKISSMQQGNNLNKFNIQIIKEMAFRFCNEALEGEPRSLAAEEKENIIAETLDEVLGLGAIEPLLKDPKVTEIMINGHRKVYVEIDGKIILTSVKLRDEAYLLNIIERIVAPLGRRIDESSPLVDARLTDGSRVNAIIPPLAINGPCLTIRKFARDPLTVDNLIDFGTITDDMAEFLQACVQARLNIIVAGGSSSGKTTTLNILSSYIPKNERIITIEDAAELQLRQEHVVRLETRATNIEGQGAVTVRDLVRNSLRMRPDRIVVGEVRGGETLDMLQAMNTGHSGSMTTGHANSSLDMFRRLETMALMSGMDIPSRALREQIASAIDLIIYQARLIDGSRKITTISEVIGTEGDAISLQDIFIFKQIGCDATGKIFGKFMATGVRPMFLEKLESNGIKLNANLFMQNIEEE